MPSIPGFEFPPRIVSSSAVHVAASGIGSSKIQVQAGEAVGQTQLRHDGDIAQSRDQYAFGDIDLTQPIRAFQGAGQSGNIIVSKLPGSESQSVPLIYSNIVQNPSFENGSDRWNYVRTSDTGSSVNIVSEFPKGVGFDNGNPDDLAVPHGTRMLHMFKIFEPGSHALYQTVDEKSHTSLLGVFQFSVAPDSNFTSAGNPAGRFGTVALQFINSGVTFYTLAYNFTGGQTPKFPPGFPSIDRLIPLSHSGSDTFNTFQRFLPSDVNATFSFTNVRIWIVTDMEDTIFPAVFDTLWDAFYLTTGQSQPELFPTQVDEKILQASATDTTGYKNFPAVLGSRDTYERDFDRSPFFFTPTELDPNTERDRREVEPFLLFSDTHLHTFENWTSNAHDVPIISAKGDIVEDEAFAPTDEVINGGFESGDFVSWVVSSGTYTGVIETTTGFPGGYFPPGIVPQEGDYFAYIAAPDTGNSESQWIRQTIVFPQNYSSEVLDLFFWQHMPSFVSSNRKFSTNVVFSNDGEDVYHLRYLYNGQVPADPPDFTELTPISHTVGATSDVLTSYGRFIQQDTENAQFTFNRADIWHIVASSFIDTISIVDAFSLTVSVPPEHLLKTNSFGHILTNTPTHSGVPFITEGTEDITQLDQTPPYFDETSPASGTSFNPTLGELSFHIKDSNAALDTTNLDVWADGVRIVNASTVETSATWVAGTKTVISQRDFRYDFTRVTDYPQQSTVTISGELADLADPVSNQSITEYYFTVLGSGTLDATIIGVADGDPPTIDLDYPADGSLQVSPSTDISWSLTDDASGVDPVSVRLLINGSIKIEDDLATAGSFSRTANSERGYDYVYSTAGPFTFGETVTGTIEASDNVGNSTSTDYEFTITPDDTLHITNFFMDQGSSVLVSSGTDISVCVEDYTYGVSTSGTEFLVNGVVPSGLVVTTSGLGPDKITYSVPAAGVMSDRADVYVHVHAENNFPGPTPVIQEQTFLLRAGYDVEWYNRSTGLGSGEETLFPFLADVQILSEIKNFGKNFNEASLFYNFLTENEPTADLGAVLVSNIKVADLPAYLNPISTHFEYGKTIVIEVEVADNEGNQLSFTHTFTIEDKPN